MKQYEITKGSRKVIIINQGNAVFARLYVDHGNVATLTAWQGKTEKGANKWAQKALAA